MSEEKKLGIAIIIMFGCPESRAIMLCHIRQCDDCRLAFQQAVDKMVGDAPCELRQHVASHIKQRLEDPEVQQVQVEVLRAEQEHYSNPANLPN